MLRLSVLLSAALAALRCASDVGATEVVPAHLRGFGNWPFSGMGMLNFAMHDFDELLSNSSFNLKQTEQCRYVLSFENHAAANMKMNINTANADNKILSASFSLQTTIKSENGNSFKSEYRMQSFAISPKCLVNAAVIRSNLAGFVSGFPEKNEEWPNKFLVVFPETEKIQQYETDGLLPRGITELLASGKEFHLNLTNLQHCLVVRGNSLDWCNESIADEDKNKYIVVSSLTPTGPDAEVFSNTVGKKFRAIAKKEDTVTEQVTKEVAVDKETINVQDVQDAKPQEPEKEAPVLGSKLQNMKVTEQSAAIAEDQERQISDAMAKSIQGETEGNFELPSLHGKFQEL